MANKALATRQKMRLRIEPSQQFGKPRNTLAGAARPKPAPLPPPGVKRKAKPQD